MPADADGVRVSRAGTIRREATPRLDRRPIVLRKKRSQVRTPRQTRGGRSRSATVEHADAGVRVERAQADAGRSRDGATGLGPARQLRPAARAAVWRTGGRLPLERGLPACGTGARRECPPRIRASTPSSRPARRGLRVDRQRAQLC